MYSPKKLTRILKTPLSWIWLTSLGRCSIYVFPTFFHTRHQNCRTGFAEYLHKSTNHLYAIIHTSPKSSHSGIKYEKNGTYPKRACWVKKFFQKLLIWVFEQRRNMKKASQLIELFFHFCLTVSHQKWCMRRDAIIFG